MHTLCVNERVLARDISTHVAIDVEFDVDLETTAILTVQEAQHLHYWLGLWLREHEE